MLHFLDLYLYAARVNHIIFSSQHAELPTARSLIGAQLDTVVGHESALMHQLGVNDETAIGRLVNGHAVERCIPNAGASPLRRRRAIADSVSVMP